MGKTFTRTVTFKDGTTHIGCYDKATGKFVRWNKKPGSQKLKREREKVRVRKSDYSESKIRRAYNKRFFVLIS